MQEPFWHCIHSRSCPYGIESIRNCDYLVSCPFGICPLGIVPIRDVVHLGSCPFGIVSVRDRTIHSGLCFLDCVQDFFVSGIRSWWNVRDLLQKKHTVQSCSVGELLATCANLADSEIEPSDPPKISDFLA